MALPVIILLDLFIYQMLLVIIYIDLEVMVVIFSASLPLNTFHRIDAGVSVQRVSRENLDNIDETRLKVQLLLVPSLSYVKDNVLWGYTSPIEGSRYNLSLFGNPGISKSKESFYYINLGL